MRGSEVPSDVSAEVRVARFIAGKRRAMLESLRRVGRRVAVGIAADAASVLGLPLEGGPVRRAQDRLRNRK